jgi:hypothetical protein
MSVTQNISNLVEYQYQLYDEYLENIKRNIINYSQNPELAIKYFKINIPKSTNINDTNGEVAPEFHAFENDDEVETFKGTGMAHQFRNFTYDIFEFSPVIELHPLQYEAAGESWIGTRGIISILSIDKPQAGDLFTFYGTKEGTTDGTEVFQVIDINYQRTSHKKIPIYQLTFRTAPMKVDTLKDLMINQVYFYNHFFNKFLNGSCWNNYKMALDFFENKKSKEFNNFYLKDKNKYIFKSCINPETNETTKVIFPMIFNNTIKRLSSLIKTNFKAVLDFSTNVSLNEFLFGKEHSTLLNEDGSKKIFKFLIYDPRELYNLYVALGYTQEENPIPLPDPEYPASTEIQINPETGEEVVIEIPEGPRTWPDIEINDETTPIAFIDKDFFSNKFTIIDNYKNGPNYQIYLKLWDLTKNTRKLFYCPGEGEEIIEPTKFDISSKIKNNKFYNIWDTCNGAGSGVISEDEIKYRLNQVNNFYNANGIINDILDGKPIIGELEVPLVISFQYGVAQF